jgi:acetyltransferase-like isoleucine patch superfamily enzyme
MENSGESFFTSKMFTSKKSALGKYRAVVVGSSGWLFFIWYEILILLFSNLPGILGIVLRGFFYRTLFKKIGRGVVFGRGMTIRNPGTIVVGEGVIFDEGTVLDAKGQGAVAITLGNHCFVGRNSVLSCKGGQIFLGNQVNIGINCLVHSDKKVTIKDNCLVASYSYIIGGGLYTAERTDIPIREQPQIYKEITIEEDVWLGAGVKVLSGITIGRSAIVAAGAVVNRDVPPLAVAGGVPAQVIKFRK